MSHPRASTGTSGRWCGGGWRRARHHTAHTPPRLHTPPHTRLSTPQQPADTTHTAAALRHSSCHIPTHTVWLDDRLGARHAQRGCVGTRTDRLRARWIQQHTHHGGGGAAGHAPNSGAGAPHTSQRVTDSRCVGAVGSGVQPGLRGDDATRCLAAASTCRAVAHHVVIKSPPPHSPCAFIGASIQFGFA